MPFFCILLSIKYSAFSYPEGSTTFPIYHFFSLLLRHMYSFSMQKQKSARSRYCSHDFLTAPVFPFGPTDMNIYGCYLCLANSPSRWVLHIFSPVGDMHDCFRSTSSLLGAYLLEASEYQPLTFFISHKSF